MSWQEQAIELKQQGYSGRGIARILGRSKSSVNSFFQEMNAQLKKNVEKVMQDSLHPYMNRGDKSFGLKIAVIGDTQCKPEEDLSYMRAIGEFLADKEPDVIVHIGDAFDFPSLSSYDKGKKSFEGRRLLKDLEAGHKGMELMMIPIKKKQRQQVLQREELYSPRMVFCVGNHEDRFDRLSRDMPELDGLVGVDTLKLEEFGWEVHPYLKPVNIGGIHFVHYLANPFTGKPYGGTALSQLKSVGTSFVVGHKQLLDVAMLPTLDGKMRIGIINGACYPFEEAYKGFQGNNHFRGVTMLNEVKDGFGLPSFASLDYIMRKYVA